MPQPPNPIHILLGALVGGVVILVGFSAAARCRPTSKRKPSERAKLAALALLFGILLGAVLLGALMFLARFEPALRARFAGRLAEPPWRPWALAFESSILEEVIFRLATLSVLTWLVFRMLGKTPRSFAVGLIGSALFFGLAHLPAWSAATRTTPLLLALVLLLNGSGGLLFGWVYWRWGLPYAVLCHFAGDVVIQALGPRLLA